MNNEEIYDKEIAPLLLQACKICQDNSIPFVAVTEFAPDEFGRTEYLGKNPSVSMLMSSWAARVRGNIDNFFLAAIRYGKEHGHNSIHLAMLKVPCDPLSETSDGDSNGS